ncbi:MAG: hypothetical protein JWM57_2812, partial [Phycisphaerales bacterium]|nr:hypothetical protein [Phycisphaerales bacterium]
GAKVLADPVLPESIMAQRQMIYPNGLSNGVGDTTNTRLNSDALELLIAHARKTGDSALEDKLTQLLHREIDSGNYSRDSRSDLFALTHYVDSLKPVSGVAAGPDRSFWFDGLNIMMQHNEVPGDAAHSLVAAFYGTNGGHVHVNGMAIELYGAGYILGADPGRGASYWTADHRGYYITPVAHNTVVVNGTSTYAENKSPDKKMAVLAAEPLHGAAALSPNIGFTRGGFHYAQPAADQQRTLALVRTGPKSGFYYDVFRSKTTGASADTFHDYFYHNMGQSLSLADAAGGTLQLKQSDTLATQPNLQKAYSYLSNERSGPLASDLRAQFDMKVPNGPTASMAMWMPASPGRKLFAVDAPKNNAIREGIAAPLREIPMPTLMVRQKGQAWDTPFVAVYEPFTGEDGAAVRAVHSATTDAASTGFVVTTVEGSGPRVLLMQDAGERDHTVDGLTFRGTFAAVFGSSGSETECYLGDGRSLAAGEVSLKSATDASIAADARRDGDSWIVGSTGIVTIALPFDRKDGQSLLVDEKPVEDAAWKAVRGKSVAVFTLPAGVNRRVYLGISK